MSCFFLPNHKILINNINYIYNISYLRTKDINLFPILTSFIILMKGFITLVYFSGNIIFKG